jgi:hypothetical protein
MHVAAVPLARLLRHAERRVTHWSVESQLTARRNAMVASTALARRRAERQEVDDFFAGQPAPARTPAQVASRR